MYWKRRQRRLKPENRIWELDAARGLCILGMVAIHLLYDLTWLYPVLQLGASPLFLFWKQWGGVLFFLISGICATLGRRSTRRGAVVLCCAVLVSAVTALVGMPVRFGVLHCLGLCMLLWGCFRPLGSRALCCFGVGFAALGFAFGKVSVSAPFLYPLGLMAPGFSSADYFPVFPYLGFFLLGSSMGKKLYAQRQSLLPRLAGHPVSRFFCFFGRHSLSVYLIHQPVLLLGLSRAFS